MAENENGADKSEEPTEKRRREAKEKGQLARSRELGTVVVTLGGIGGLLISGGSIGQSLIAVMQGSFDLPRATLLDESAMSMLLVASGLLVLKALLPFLLALSVASIAGAVSLGGWLFSGQALALNFSRLNPVSGLQRMFSSKSLVELLKALAKFLVVLLVALAVLCAYAEDLISIAKQPLETAILHSMEIVGWSSLWMACGLILIAAVDVPYQLWDNRQKLMMTKQEVRDEYKDSDGKPEVKSRIRQLQREMLQRRMMQAVPEADVVITNPTHLAVALSYRVGEMSAPRVLGKGAGFIAEKIREIARQKSIPIVENQPLARLLYSQVEVGREVPETLYRAVAEVLAYVYRLRRGNRASVPASEAKV